MPLPITDLSVGCFRGLRDVALHDLGSVNILVGPNNSGKTSVLEVLSLAANPLDPLQWMHVAAGRDPFGFALRAGFHRQRWMFPQDSTRDPVSSYDGHIDFTARGSLPFHQVRAAYQDLRSIPPTPTPSSALSDVVPAASDAVVERMGVRIDIEVTSGPPELERHESFTWWEGERFELPPMGPIVSVPLAVVTPHDHLFPGLPARYSEARRQGRADAIARVLSLIDPRITGLEVLAAPGSTRERAPAFLYVRHGSAGLLPLEAFGDGIRRVLLIATAIVSAHKGMLLIDELETAIHVSALGDAFRWMVDACKENAVQLFVTTHSLEAIDALLVADQTPAQEDIVAYRLDAAGQTVTVRRYGEDLLRRLRMERGAEVR
jgi:energy-coupling factor transporter ATP-binding protein EcfA2